MWSGRIIASKEGQAGDYDDVYGIARESMNRFSSLFGTSLRALLSLVTIFATGCSEDEVTEQKFLNLPPLQGTERTAIPTPLQIAEALHDDEQRRDESRILDVDFGENPTMTGWKCVGSGKLRVTEGRLQVPALETCLLRWRMPSSALAQNFTHLALRLAEPPKNASISEFRLYWRHNSTDSFDKSRVAVAPYQ